MNTSDVKTGAAVAGSISQNLSHDPITLQQLEFSRILSRLSELLATPYGRSKLAEIDFAFDIPTVEARLQEVHEMSGLLTGGHSLQLSGFEDIRPSLDKSKPEDAFLEAKELLAIKSTLELMKELVFYCKSHLDEAPSLATYAGRIHHHRNIVREIEGTIDRGGEIHDNASPELRQIRIRIRSLASEQKKVLQRVQKRYADYSQDELVTLRDGRQVLGIIPSFINKVNGIVHGTSASGNTVFIEPMETLSVSNEIQNLKIRERTEIIKILRFLTGLVREVRNDIFYGLENVALLDVVLAKARLAGELQATKPQISDKPVLDIRDARHPLLILKTGYDNVVPLSMTLGKDYHILVITGPNAGGKTVSMKTIGLLILMTQMGMLIPADPKSVIPLLPKILVDIGDRQSIEDDLSTFSARIVRLKQIVEQVDDKSLVLLDEVGSGTDPREGSALSIALLELLVARKVLAISTTHHGELKAYAHSAEHVENASMEFDPETLQPTYRLRSGVPGSSYAFEIARRYGLPATLIDHAVQQLGSDKGKLESLILELDSRIRKQEKMNGELSIKLSKAEAMRKLYEAQLSKLKENKLKLKQEAAEEARRIIEKANSIIEKSVKDIKSSNAASAAIKEARQAVKQEKEKLADLLSDQPASAAVEKPEVVAGPLMKGDRVFAESLGETGELLEDAGRKKKVRVQIGNIKMTLETASLRKTKRKLSEKGAVQTVFMERSEKIGKSIGPELDLRGMDSEQAVEETNLYLHDAVQSDWDEVRIVHGKGTGVLRRTVNDFLSRDKRVLNKRPGKWGEGDSGVTVVTLKK